MLPDELTQLLTAYVDGELTPRQRKAVGRLLQRSSAARILLVQLEENARQVRQLPRRKLDASIVPEVMQAIENKGLHITLPAAPVAPRRWLSYTVAAMAASVLVAALGGLWYMSGQQHEPAYASNTPPAPVVVPAPKVAARKPNPLIPELVAGVVQSYTAPLPDDKEQKPQPFSIAFRELQKDLAADRLVAQLQKERSLQLDISVKNSAKALERLQGVLQEHGIKVVVDGATAKDLKQANAKVEYVVYAENLRTDELTRILRELGRDDNRLQTFQRSPFDKLTMAPLTEGDKKQVSGLIGAAPGRLDVEGGKKDEEPKFKRWDRSAVVLPGQAARRSPELQEFAGRPRPQAGTLQVLLRIRQ
jgi:acetolactate synthase regulatory subunit